jgi:hypothetical protein
MDQPTTEREYRSMMTARYSQPSELIRYVMSPAHFWFGAVATKFCSNKLGDTGKLWSLSVVTTNLRAAFGTYDWRRILAPIVLISYG